ncbi:MAG: hypothetical protein ACPL5I_11295 [Thermodesulfobacteriota bacterium]
MIDTSRLWGGLLCLAIVIIAGIFLWGVFQQNYWALAIPVMIGFLGLLGLAFWIGWTILTIKTVPPVPEPNSGGQKEESSTSLPSKNTPES